MLFFRRWQKKVPYLRFACVQMLDKQRSNQQESYLSKRKSTPPGFFSFGLSIVPYFSQVPLLALLVLADSSRDLSSEISVSGR